MFRSPPDFRRGGTSWLGPARRLLAWGELRRIRNLPRYRPFQTRVLGPLLKGVDGRSSYYAFHEIFGKRNYEFASRTACPRIIDGGSNIGLSLIFFKQLFPAARVTGFEPDPTVFAVLKENMRSFGLCDVELVNKALWVRDDRLDFHCDGADGGRLHHGHSGGEHLQVEARRLRSYLEEPVEMLKLDIEGAEVEVLLDCRDQLSRVSNCFVEYHSFAGQPQRLDELLSALRQTGFRVQIHTQFGSPHPLVARRTTLEMDFQADIAAYRE